MTKEQSGKDILTEAKNKVKKQKENNTMKTPKKTIILTVLSTLVIIATIIGLLFVGWTLRGTYEDNKNAEVHSQVKALTAVTVKK